MNLKLTLILLSIAFCCHALMAQTDTEATAIRKTIKKEKGKYGIRDGKTWKFPAEYDEIRGISLNPNSSQINSLYYKCMRGDVFDLLYAPDPKKPAAFKFLAKGVSKVVSEFSRIENTEQEYLFFQQNGKWGWFIRKARMDRNGSTVFLENCLELARFDSLPFIQELGVNSYTDFNNFNLVTDSAGLKGLTRFDGRQIVKFGPYTHFTWDKDLEMIIITGKNKLKGYVVQGHYVEPMYTEIIKSQLPTAQMACTLPDGKTHYRNGAEAVPEKLISETEIRLQQARTSEVQRQIQSAKRTESFFDKKSQKYGIRDTSGRRLVEAKFDQLGPEINGLMQARIGNKYGFVDAFGREIIPIKYEATESKFSEELVAVKLHGKWGYVDKNDQPIISFQFDQAYHFQNGKAKVLLNGKMQFIDKKGNSLP